MGFLDENIWPSDWSLFHHHLRVFLFQWREHGVSGVRTELAVKIVRAEYRRDIVHATIQNQRTEESFVRWKREEIARDTKKKHESVTHMLAQKVRICLCVSHRYLLMGQAIESIDIILPSFHYSIFKNYKSNIWMNSKLFMYSGRRMNRPIRNPMYYMLSIM